MMSRSRASTVETAVDGEFESTRYARVRVCWDTDSFSPRGSPSLSGDRTSESL
jgi:hypothetical protein